MGHCCPHPAVRQQEQEGGCGFVHTASVLRCASCRNNMLEAGDWLVVVDTVSIADSSLGKRYRALQVLPHPRFNKYSNDYDVGLLHTIADMDMTGERRRSENASRVLIVSLELDLSCSYT